MIKRRVLVLLSLLLSFCLLAPPLAADDDDFRYLLRAQQEDVGGILMRHGLMLLLAIEDPEGELWLVLNDDDDIDDILLDPDVIAFEAVLEAFAPGTPGGLDVGTDTDPVLDALDDTTQTDFQGLDAWVGYVEQPATEIIELPGAHGLATGDAVVAVLDTGVDPGHRLLVDALVPGYDFVNEIPGVASEWIDVSSVTAGLIRLGSDWTLVEPTAAELNDFTAWVLDQSGAWILEDLGVPASFGHGTMVAGIIRLIAPTARIMPLKVFDGAGRADTAGIVRALYHAVANGADVINMSFSQSGFSAEVERAINYAAAQGVVSVASAGNQGSDALVYPAALGNVLGIASTDDADQRSAFSNFGDDLVTLAAPGEVVVTLFPGGSYSAGWGTSFSAPMVAAAAALLEELADPGDTPIEDYYAILAALAHAEPLPGQRLGHGRLDAHAAVCERVEGGCP